MFRALAYPPGAGFALGEAEVPVGQRRGFPSTRGALVTKSSVPEPDARPQNTRELLYELPTVPKRVAFDTSGIFFPLLCLGSDQW